MTKLTNHHWTPGKKQTRYLLENGNDSEITVSEIRTEESLSCVWCSTRRLT
jgi:hypothetical protein